MSSGLIAWLESLQHWHWWILAVILVGLEIVAPGYVLLWIGIAAMLTGLLKFIIAGLAWEIQFLVFSITSLVTVIYVRIYLRKNPLVSDQPNLSRRGEQYIGKTYTLETAIENGVGRVKVGDTVWRVEGSDIAAGSKVKVVDVNGASFVVEPIES